MNKLIISVSVLLATTFQAKSQDIDSVVAKTFANKLRDSLALTQSQTDSIYQISKALRIEKRDVWAQYKNSKDLNQRMLQEDEKRDSLFRNVLGDEKFTLYFQKRRQFLLAN